MALADDVINISNQTASMPAQATSDAMQAYHIASTAANARQQLDIQKDEHEQNKATWLAQQVHAINQASGPARKLLTDNLAKNAPSVYPNINTDNIKMMGSDPDLSRGAAIAAQKITSGQQLSPEEIQQLPSMFASQPDAFHQSILALGQQHATVEAGKVKAQGFEGRVNAMNDNMTASAVNKVHSDPMVKTLVGQGMSLDKGNQILNDPNHHASWTELNEVAQDFAKVLNGGQISSDFKLKELQSPSFQKFMGQLKASAESDPNQPANPETVAFWQHFGNRLNSQIDTQLAQAAGRHASGMKAEFYHNPNLQPAVSDAIKTYKSGAWRSDPNITGGASAPAAAAAAAPQPSAVRMIGPDGKMRMIPADQAEAAKAAGGKVAP